MRESVKRPRMVVPERGIRRWVFAWSGREMTLCEAC